MELIITNKPVNFVNFGTGQFGQLRGVINLGGFTVLTKKIDRTLYLPSGLTSFFAQSLFLSRDVVLIHNVTGVPGLVTSSYSWKKKKTDG